MVWLSMLLFFERRRIYHISWRIGVKYCRKRHNLNKNRDQKKDIHGFKEVDIFFFAVSHDHADKKSIFIGVDYLYFLWRRRFFEDVHRLFCDTTYFLIILFYHIRRNRNRDRLWMLWMSVEAVCNGQTVFF